MKFKTGKGQEAYVELVEEASSRAAKMYEDLKKIASSDPRDVFMFSLSIEEFRHSCLSRAIMIGTQVDAEWARVQGGIALAQMNIDEMR